MGLRFTVLASGSGGNATLVEAAISVCSSTPASVHGNSPGGSAPSNAPGPTCMRFY